jgi:hypothetical protein
MDGGRLLCARENFEEEKAGGRVGLYSWGISADVATGCSSY